MDMPAIIFMPAFILLTQESAMKKNNCGAIMNHRIAIAKYHNKTTPADMSCHRHQKILNTLSTQPGSLEKNNRALAILDLLLLITNTNIQLMTYHIQQDQPGAPVKPYLSGKARRTMMNPDYPRSPPFAPTLAVSNPNSSEVGRRQEQLLGWRQLKGFFSQTFNLPGANAAYRPTRHASDVLNGLSDGSSAPGSVDYDAPAFFRTEILSSLLRQYPDLHRLAREKIKTAIMRTRGIDVDPDKVYYHRFSSAMNDPFSFSGWQHGQQDLVESKTLTSCVLHNFSAATQDNMDSIDMMSGVYSLDAQAATTYGYANEVKILPSQLAKLIWEMNFYQEFKTALDAYWLDPQLQEIRNIYMLIDTLKNSRLILTKEHMAMLMIGFGLSETSANEIIISFFDINGYYATDMLIFQSPHLSDLILYMPRVKQAIPFTNLRDLRQWIIYSCVDEIDRRALAQHFSINDRQGNIFYDGIDRWLQTLHQETDRYFERIVKSYKRILGSVSRAIILSQKQRSYQDADQLIKSNNEVREDMAVRYFSVVNTLLPNPITPFVSLALDLDLSFNADTTEEREKAIAGVANDIVNIALVALTEIGAKKARFTTDNEQSFNTIMRTDDITELMQREMVTTKKILGSSNADAYLQQCGFMRQHFFSLEANQQNVIVHPEVMAEIKRIAIPDVIMEHAESLLWDDNGVIIGRNGNHYLQINTKYYEISESNVKNRFSFVNDKKTMIFLDEGHEKKMFFLSDRDSAKFEDFSYSCRGKRAPSTIIPSCPGFDRNLAKRLSNLDSGIEPSIANSLVQHPDTPYLYRNNVDGRTFIKFNNAFFQVKTNPRKDYITLYKRCANSSLKCINGNIVKGPTIFYSERNNKFYLNDKIGRLQDISGFSYSLAKLDLFCQKNPATQLTREEIFTLQRYASLDYDAINEFMRAGRPDNYLNGFFRQHLHESINTIERCLQKIPPYNDIVYRGTLLPPEDFQRINTDDLLHSLSFVSSSADPEIARISTVETSSEKIGVFYEIKLKKAGHPIALFTSRMREAEVLIEANSWFKVEKKEDGALFLNEIQLESVDKFRQQNPLSMTYTL